MTPQERAAIKRVKAIADGAMINITYRQLPLDALEVFRKDLQTIYALVQRGERENVT